MPRRTAERLRELENDGERLTLVDETGRIVQTEDLLTLYAVIFARTKPNARIAVPVTAPGRIEQLVALHGGTVTRTKTDVRDLMGLARGATRGTPDVDFAGDTAGGFVFSEFMPAFDSMFAFGKLVEMMSVTGLSIGEMVSELPPNHLVETQVRCPWEVKGRIMRELTREATDAGEVELIDGIKIREGDSWALVLPDASEPYFHVYAEGESAEQANGLMERYVHRIEELRGL